MKTAIIVSFASPAVLRRPTYEIKVVFYLSTFHFNSLLKTCAFEATAEKLWILLSHVFAFLYTTFS